MADTATMQPPIAIALKEEAATAAPPERIELRVAVPSTRECGTLSGDEIVVCAPDSAVYRLGPVMPTPDRALPQAKLKLSGSTTVAAQLQAGNVGPTPTNRAMVSVKVAF